MYRKFLTRRFLAFSHVRVIPPRRAATAQVHGRPIVSALPFSVVNTPPHRNPLHLVHSAKQINVQNFAGYFSEFSTLINVRRKNDVSNNVQPVNSSHPARLSRPTYRQMGRSRPESSAEHPKSAAKLNVLTTLRLKSNRNSNLRDPLPPMSLSISTLTEFIFPDDTQPYGCMSFSAAHLFGPAGALP